MGTLLVIGLLLVITTIGIPCVVEGRKEEKRQKIVAQMSYNIEARKQMLALIAEDRRHNDAEWLIFRREMLRENLKVIRKLQEEYVKSGGEILNGY